MAAPGAERPTEAGRRVPRLPALRLRTRLARGDRRAFAELFERYQGELYRYCMALLRDPDDAQDALQATLTAALESLPGDSREIEPRPWLFRVAHNKAISMLRERSHEELPRDAAAADGDPSETHAARERLRRLVVDLNALPERQRSALVMRELSDLRYPEIASALDCGEGAARQAVYEARVSLREREAGREMSCDSVQRALSDGDRRKLRGVRIRAHLRQCDSCLAFQHAIEDRREDLRALTGPLPIAAAGSMLAGLATGGGAGGSVAGGALGGGGAAAGAAATGSVAVKGASIAAGVVLALGAADVSGVVELPKPGGKQEAQEVRPASSGSTDDAGENPSAGSDASSQQGAIRHSGTGRGGSGSPGGRDERARDGRVAQERQTEPPTGSGASASENGGAGAPPTADASPPARGNAGNGAQGAGVASALGQTGLTPGRQGTEPPGATRPPGTPAAPASSGRPQDPPAPPPHSSAPENAGSANRGSSHGRSSAASSSGGGGDRP